VSGSIRKFLNAPASSAVSFRTRMSLIIFLARAFNRPLSSDSHERGLDDAFRRIGRRIVVDPERYRELVRARSG
jgi:hypothetical protein